MNEKKSENIPRYLLTDGATMEYAGSVRAVFWGINLLLYILLNMFYLRVQTGEWLQLEGPYISESLIPNLLSPLNIFEFPSFIIVMGLVMGLICTVPILIAQLYNFLYSIPFLFSVFFVGHNPVLTLCLLVSCGSVSFKPMRFKSKFVSVLLALAPPVLYWILFSGENPEQDVLRWAVLYSPWGLAFVVCVVIFGIVLTIGHFLRYRPGILLPIFGLVLAGTVMLFRSEIGMDERDFQAEVYRYSPGQVVEFQNRSIKGLLEAESAERQKQYPYLSTELLMRQLQMEWRWAFSSRMSSMLNGQEELSEGNPISPARNEAVKFAWTKLTCLVHIENFIITHGEDKKAADAQYYKALLIDLKVDTKSLRDEDMLRFYHDVPSSYSKSTWREILDKFGDFEVGIEARHRLARFMAGRKPQKTSDTYKFDEALVLLEKAQELCRKTLRLREQTSETYSFWMNQLGTIFKRPAPTISDEELKELKIRIGKLMVLIDKENRTGHLRHEERLAQFVGLDRHQLHYESKLKELMLEAPQPDPLQDNIELALAMLVKDPDEKIAKLTKLTNQYPNSDGGIEAMLELAEALLEQRSRSEHRGDQEHLLEKSQELLQKVAALGDKSFYGEYAQEVLKETHQLK